MGRLLAIDFGRRRCGIAVTDTMRIVATALQTVETPRLEAFLKEYTSLEPVDRIIVGLPTDMHGNPSESMRYITPAINRLRKVFPSIPVEFFDERFTSVIAHRGMIDSGMKRMQRRSKEVVDRMAATIILNDYLQSRQYTSQPPKN